MFASQWKSGGYRIKSFPGDHDPSHVHVYGDDIANKKMELGLG